MAPVTLNRAVVQDSIMALPARELCTGGNIYAFGQYLFVNENRKGYHLLDNTDKSNPRTVAFLQIPGATHMAFVGGRMVSDSYADMVVLDFAGPDRISLISSTPNFLLEATGFVIGEDQIAVGFEPQEVSFRQNCDGTFQNNWGGRWVNFEADFGVLPNASSSGGSGAGVNTGGSLARLAFCDNRLYVLGHSMLRTYDLVSDELIERNTQELGWGQEAMILRSGYLYVASQAALTIYDVRGCREPERIGFAPHRWANDPVAVEGDRAVLTVRWGEAGQPGSGGEMMVFDISDRTNPVELSRHPLSFPVGVQLHDGMLYIFDQVSGLLAYDFRAAAGASRNYSTLPSHLVQEIQDAGVTDGAVLPYSDGPTLLTIGSRSLRQYSLGSDRRLAQLAQLNVEPCVAP